MNDMLDIQNIVCDYNGTIAKDGKLLPVVAPYFELLAKKYTLYVITADTFGSVQKELEGLQVRIKILQSNDHTEEKAHFINSLDASRTVAIGNGNNDILMLQDASISIALIGDEGCSTKALLSAQIVVNDIKDALELLIHQKRLKATLRK